ncbi:MAG: thioredoxin [Candidatus Latescibacteria bacterium]|nr:thioredoxin [Candidatus Latescibacterota bacterium]
MAYPSVYPTGTTIFYPDQCFNGYTVFPMGNPADAKGIALIDMSGQVVHAWNGLSGFPAKILPGGFVMGSTGVRNPKYGYLDNIDLVQVDWQGNVVWKFAKYQLVRDPRSKAKWMARQHHDYQRQGNPVGYYAPGMDPVISGGNTLLLAHKDVRNGQISEKPLLDDTIIEVTWDGKIVWEWSFNEHFDEMGFDEAAKNTMARNPNMVPAGGGVGDWLHVNSVSRLGPNKWHDEGDARFHPDNIIWSSRQTNIFAIVDRQSGKIVWRLGPDYDSNPALRKLGWIIGPHHPHLIPQGLPGAGNILVFDNGGLAGYGSPNPGSPTGHNHARRDYSRVLEINPLTLEIVWQYSAVEAGFPPILEAYKFYSSFVSSAQRLPNGNTLITEGTDGRLIEVTSEHEIVWEYISPYFGKQGNHNMVYRAYRLPYGWIPQLDEPVETPVPRLDNSKFRVGEGGGERAVMTQLKRGGRVNPDPQLCIVAVDG